MVELIEIHTELALWTLQLRVKWAQQQTGILLESLSVEQRHTERQPLKTNLQAFSPHSPGTVSWDQVPEAV